LSSALKQNSSFSSAVSLKNGTVEAGLLLGSAPYPMALWSLDQQLCVFNSPASKLLGYSEQEIKYHPELYLDRIHPEDRGVFASAWQRLRLGEKSSSCCYRFVPKHDSEPRTLQENSFLLQDAAALTFYSEVRNEGEKAAKGHRLRSLLRGISHEIGNNLQAISGELELLRWSGNLPAESAAVVSSAIMHIRTLTGDVEEYFSPLAGRFETNDFPAVLSNVIQERAEKTRASGIETEIAVNGTLPKVFLDDRLVKTLKAVMDFSCALLAGGGDLKVEAGLCRRGEAEYIEVDFVSCCRTTLPIQGDHVFRPFVNFGRYRSGLSLTVARRALRRRFGEIAFRKEDGNRGVFSILIPVAKPAV
jgi:K+-sensing histidine kinase KdpD